MTDQLTVKFFDDFIEDDDVKQLLLRSQPGDFYWGAPYRPPYLINCDASRHSTTWTISGALSWEPPKRDDLLSDLPGVTVRLHGAYDYPEQVVTQEHLRQALMSLALGAVFSFDTYWYRVVKREIWLATLDQAELTVVVEPT